MGRTTYFWAEKAVGNKKDQAWGLGLVLRVCVNTEDE